MAITRLGNQFSIKGLIDEVQVLSGQLDPELVPRRSIGEHLNVSTQEVVSLLNNLCAPFYGVQLKVSNANLSADPNGLASTTGTLKAVTVYGTGGNALSFLIDNTDSPKVDKVIAVTNNIVGTTKESRDLSQFYGIAFGGNSQWARTAQWKHFGNYVHLWYGSLLDTPPDFYFSVYRQAINMDATEAIDTIIDLPDKYVPLVVAKATLMTLKQAKMGNYQEVEGQINQGIAQIQAEWEKSMGMAAQRPAMEAVERTSY